MAAHQVDAQAAECDDLSAVIAIAVERSGYLTGMKAALINNDDPKLKYFASKLCGMATPAITSAEAS
jgi:hypothetical protein